MLDSNPFNNIANQISPHKNMFPQRAGMFYFSAIPDDNSFFEDFNTNYTNPIQENDFLATGFKTKRKHKGKHRKLNANKIAKKHKDNPLGALRELDVKFTDSQIDTLSNCINDEKSLKQFIKFAENEDITTEDMVEGLKATKKHKPRSWYERLKYGFEHPMEALKYWQSEAVYIAEKTSQNMAEIRKYRDELHSALVAELGFDCAEKPEQTERTMHFVTKQNKDGNYLYGEDALITAHRYTMGLNEELANRYMVDVVELESITTPEGYIKYNGNSIVNVAQKMTENENLRDTIICVAQKSDMTDNCLVNVTNTLCENPEIENTVRYIATAKAEDGSDLYSAQNLNSYCFDAAASKAETVNVTNQNADSKDTGVVVLVQTLDPKPQLVEKTVDVQSVKNNESTKIENTDEKNGIKNSVKDFVEGLEKEINVLDKSALTTNDLLNIQIAKAENKNTASNPIKKSKKSLASPKKETVNVVSQNDKKPQNAKKPQNYKRSEMLKELKNHYGTEAEKILQMMEKDSLFVELMKIYGNNKTLRASLIKNPNLISKLKRTSATLTATDLANMVVLCKNPEMTETMILLSTLMTPQYAIEYLKSPKNTEEILALLEKNTISRDQKINTIKSYKAA